MRERIIGPRWRIRASVIALAWAATPGSAPASAQAQGSVMAREVGLEFEQITLPEALNRIRRSTGIGLVYSPDVIPPGRMVACPCSEKTLRQALDLILRGTGLTVTALGDQILIVPLRKPPRQPRSGAIVGTVTGSPDNTPVPNALVQLDNGRRVLAGQVGRFVFANVRPGTYSLTVTGIGWEPSEMWNIRVVSGDTARVAIRLQASVIPLPEIIVAPSRYGIFAGPLQEQSLTREEVQTLPHLGEDIFRAAYHLPGVTSYDATAKLYVRGSRSEEVLTVLDGLELYEPYHLKNWDGTLSIVDLEAVDEVDLMTGGFPAEYGDKGTGVFAMRTAQPQPENQSTALGLSVGNITFKSQGSFADGAGSWLASARRGFFDLLFKLMGEDEDFSPAYYDLFAKVRYQASPKHRVSGHLLRAGDDIVGTEDDRTGFRHGYGSSYAWLNWNAILSDALTARTVLAVGRVSRNRTGDDFGGAQQLLDVRDDGTYGFVNLKQDWSALLSDRVVLKSGLDLKRGTADYDYLRWRKVFHPNTTDPFRAPWTATWDTLSVKSRLTGHEIGFYVAGRFQRIDPLVAEVGLRYDRQSHTHESTLAPRVNVAVALLPRTVLRGAWGWYYQSHGLHELYVADGDVDFYPAQRSEHRILGLEHRLPNGTLFRVEAYQRRTTDPLPEYRNLVPRVEALREEGPEDRVFIQPSRQSARGIEIFAKGAQGRSFAWTGSYALAVAEDEIGGEWFARPHDQRHSIQVQTAYRPSAHWSVSMGWLYRSGWPYTREDYIRQDLAPGGVHFTRTYGPLNGERLPAYHRLDARLSRRFEWASGRLFAYLDVFNLYGRENPEVMVHNVGFDPMRDELTIFRGIDGQLGMLPTFGLRWEF